MRLLITICIMIIVCLIGSVILSYFRSPGHSKLADRLGGNETDEEIRNTYIPTNTLFGRLLGRQIENDIAKDDSLIQRYSKMLHMNMEGIDADIKYVGIEKKFNAEEVVTFKIIGIAASVFIALMYALTGSYEIILIGLVLCYVCVIYPSSRISEAKKSKKRKIEQELPEFVELLKTTLDAGISIKEALKLTASYLSGEIAEELKHVMIETKSNGGDWAQAMEKMSLSNAIPTLSNVVSTILISAAMGTSISSSLDGILNQIRQVRNASCKEQANKLSSSLVIPMMIFDLVPFFIIIFAPLILNFNATV